MSKRRDRTAWVIEPDSRTTINEMLGGLFYDFIDDQQITLSSRKIKQLLSCVREDTRMSDRTLKHVFKGETNSVTQLMRILVSVHSWLGKRGVELFMTAFCKWFLDFCDSQGEEFLEEQALLNRPKRRNV